MDFDLRAISLAPSVPSDARTPVSDLLGKEVQFRAGLTIAMTLPDDPTAFSCLPEPERLLTAVDSWARVFDYPHGEDPVRYILAPAENPAADGELLFYRLDFLQPARVKPGPRPPVEILGGAVMTYNECATWLANVSFTQAKVKGTILHRPRLNKKAPLVRIAWVGPERLGGESIPDRLNALGNVIGAEIIHVGPQSFAHVKARLAGFSPLHAIALCIGAATYITGDVAPKTLSPEAIHHCSGTNPSEVYAELIAIFHKTRSHSNQEGGKEPGDEEELLRLMLRGMMSHSKIGPFNHCNRETVLTAVRARRLNVPAADALIDKHSEAHQDTKASEKLFLWKDHNDGRQYFLNPKKVEHVKVLIATG
jgi:hypothetical protein